MSKKLPRPRKHRKSFKALREVVAAAWQGIFPPQKTHPPWIFSVSKLQKTVSEIVKHHPELIEAPRHWGHVFSLIPDVCMFVYVCSLLFLDFLWLAGGRQGPAVCRI